jgi:hypothetical protein
MSTASSPLAMNSYFTKWKGGYKSWKDNPTVENITDPSKSKINEPNTCAAPKGSAAGMAFNQVPDNYLATDYPTNTNLTPGWYPKHRPLKIWRRSYSSTSGKVPIRTMDTPGGTIFRNDLCARNDTILDQTKIAYKKAELEQTVTLEKEGSNPAAHLTLEQILTHIANHDTYEPWETFLAEIIAKIDKLLQEYIKEITKKGGCGVTIISDYLTKENRNTTCCRPTRYDMSGNVVQTTDFAKQRAQLVRNGATFGTKYCNEDKKYYTTTGAYLKARCNNFATKAITARPAFSAVKDTNGVTTGYVDSRGKHVDAGSVDFYKYITNCSYSENEDMIAWLEYKIGMLNINNQPPHTPTAAQNTYNLLLSQARNKNTQCCVNTIYKPCNTKFSTNTAVSSSSRIARLKYDTVTTAAQNQRHVWGPEAASASAYSGRPEMPFTTKAKFSPCAPHRIAGTKTACFYINPSKKAQGLILSDGESYK